MNGNTPWAELLPAAVAVAISPVPISAVILTLFSRRPRSNGAVFLVGWIAGLAAIACCLAPLAEMVDAVPERAEASRADTLRLLMGLLFLAFALVQWLRRPKAGEAHELPAWTARIEDFGPWQSLLVALGLCVINPKNLALVFAVLVALGDVRGPAWQVLAAMMVFILLGSVTIAVPVLYRLFAGTRADVKLDASKQWLLANRSTVMMLLFLMMGATLVGKGLEGYF